VARVGVFVQTRLVAARDPVPEVRLAVRQHGARRRRRAARGRRDGFGARAPRRDQRVGLQGLQGLQGLRASERRGARGTARLQERKRRRERRVQRVFVFVFRLGGAVLLAALGALGARRAAERQLAARQGPGELSQGVRREHGTLGVGPDDRGGEPGDQAVAGHLQQPPAALGVAGDVGDDQRRVQAAIGGRRLFFFLLPRRRRRRRGGEIRVQDLREPRFNRHTLRSGSGGDERAARGVVLLAARVAAAAPALRGLAHQAVHAVQRVERNLGSRRVPEQAREVGDEARCRLRGAARAGRAASRRGAHVHEAPPPRLIPRERRHRHHRLGEHVRVEAGVATRDGAWKLPLALRRLIAQHLRQTRDEGFGVRVLLQNGGGHAR
jgi:hypothetical protein